MVEWKQKTKNEDDHEAVLQFINLFHKWATYVQQMRKKNEL